MMITKLSAALRNAVLASLLLTLAGCAVWTRIDTETQEGPGGKYSVQAPLGWVRFNLAEESILITRDGLPIQHIRVLQDKDESYFKQTKVKLPANVLPSDLAHMVIAEMRSDPTLLNLSLRETLPYTVAGQPGFKAHFQYRDERGTLFDRVVLGSAREKEKEREVIVMVYHGLHTHYFARDLHLFYQVASSFKSHN